MIEVIDCDLDQSRSIIQKCQKLRQVIADVGEDSINGYTNLLLNK